MDKMYCFSAILAEQLGVIEAVFLQELYHTICQHSSLCIAEDGKVWFPCTIKEWSAYIPLWSCRQTDRITKNCLHQGTLNLRHYDDDERRRRGWYAINPSLIPELNRIEMLSGR